jgi:hypothetical protein
MSIDNPADPGAPSPDGPSQPIAPTSPEPEAPNPEPLAPNPSEPNPFIDQGGNVPGQADPGGAGGARVL